MAKRHLTQYDSSGNRQEIYLNDDEVIVEGGQTLKKKLSDMEDDIDHASQGGYAPPQGGIPKTDLAEPVQDSLDKADSALQDNDVAEVAKTGNYDDLQNKPTIPDTSGLATKTELQQGLAGKVDKENGKSLMTDAEHTKLANLPTGADLTTALDTKQDKLQAGNGIVIGTDGKTVSVDAEVVEPATADGTFSIRVGNNTYTINLNHSHPQYLTAQSLKAGSNVSLSVNQQTGEVTISSTGGSGTSYDDTEVRQLISNLSTALQTLNNSLAAVATSGSYNDLSNKPTIPDITNLATKAEIANIGKIVNVNGGDVMRIWIGTQAEYDALEDLDDDVVYLQALVYRPKVVLDLYDASVPQNTPTNVDIGSSFSVTVTPKAGFSFTRISGTMTGGTLTKTENQDGSVTFSTSGVTGKITISASATTAKIANAGGKLSVMAAKTFADDPSHNTDSGGQGNIGVFVPQGSDKWDMRAGLLFDGFLQAYDAYNGGSEDVSTLLNWPRGYYRRHINANGEIISSYSPYAASKGNSDHVSPGYNLFRLLDLDASYATNYNALAGILHGQLVNYQGKLTAGTTAHPYIQRNTYQHQTILEVTHSIEPFRAMYAKEKLTGQEQAAEYEDIIAQMNELGELTYDSTTKLYRHGYTETGSGVHWADNQSNDEVGKSYFTFGRALGMYILAIERVLEIIPSTVSGWQDLKMRLVNLLENLDGKKDATSKVWAVLPTEMTSTNNYLDASSSSLYAYGLLHAIRKGWLDESYKPLAKETYEAVVAQFATISGTSLTIEGCVKSGNSGGSATDRAGVLSNYYSVANPAQSGEPYGTGAFILASVEYEEMFCNE